MTSRPIALLCALLSLFANPAFAQTAQSAGGGPAAERLFQGYLALWSKDADINAAAIARFYAPSVSYYGRHFDRDQLLAEKRAFIRNWPVRRYEEVPGSMVARCEPGRMVCHTLVDVRWQRISRHGRTDAGTSKMAFTFAMIGKDLKITKESARRSARAR